MTICAPHESYDAIIEWHTRLTIAGHVVLLPPIHKDEWDEEKINLSDALQLIKIELSDALFVLDIGAKVVKRMVFQIKKAQEMGKKIYFLSKEYPDWKPDEYQYAIKTKEEYKKPNLSLIIEQTKKLQETIEEVYKMNKDLIG